MSKLALHVRVFFDVSFADEPLIETRRRHVTCRRITSYLYVIIYLHVIFHIDCGNVF